MWMPSGGSRATAIKRRLATCVLMVLLVLALGCQAPSGASKSQWTAAKIDSFESIAGKWAGLMVREPRSRQEDWVQVAITDDGRYEFVSVRSIGAFSGKGQFTLEEGRLKAAGERGTVTGGLMTSGGRQMLRIFGVMNDGVQYKADLTRSR